jgi:hypothetical protein
VHTEWFFRHHPQLGAPRSHFTFRVLHVSQDTDSGRLRFEVPFWLRVASSPLESPLQLSWSSSAVGERCDSLVPSGLTYCWTEVFAAELSMVCEMERGWMLCSAVRKKIHRGYYSPPSTFMARALWGAAPCFPRFLYSADTPAHWYESLTEQMDGC